eukprot:scaffold12020_cov122-Isochrysis_galbana.AAC.17
MRGEQARRTLVVSSIYSPCACARNRRAAEMRMAQSEVGVPAPSRHSTMGACSTSSRRTLLWTSCAKFPWVDVVRLGLAQEKQEVDVTAEASSSEHDREGQCGYHQKRGNAL